MKVVILGSTGMLGWAVSKRLIKTFGEDNVGLSYRDERYSYGKHNFTFTIPYTKYSFYKISGDVVVNCIGVTNRFSDHNIAHTILVNSVFPHDLANYCKNHGMKLIHITTDCVFSGATGAYTEQSTHDAIDIYGRSKSMGEPRTCMSLRTSIVGEEIKGRVNLLEWVKSNKGGRIKGFKNHIWNGLTTDQLAIVIENIISHDLYQDGVYHIFSPAPVSKYELLALINDKFQLNLEIEPVDADPPINRSLSTIHELNSKLSIPTIQEQITKIGE